MLVFAIVVLRDRFLWLVAGGWSLVADDGRGIPGMVWMRYMGMVDRSMVVWHGVDFHDS
jgi:hypothetical protein